MPLSSSCIDLPLATVERTTQDLVEVRFKTGAVLNTAGITAMIDARRQLAGGRPMRVLMVFPDVEMDFELGMITRDHYEMVPITEFTQAVAWVSGNIFNERFCKLYFAYFPSPVPTAIFRKEEEARAWLDGQ